MLDVIDHLTTKELEVKCQRGRWWSVRIRPYRTTDNKIDGAVIAVLDIDAAQEQRAAIRPGPGAGRGAGQHGEPASAWRWTKTWRCNSSIRPFAGLSR